MRLKASFLYENFDDKSIIFYKERNKMEKNKNLGTHNENLRTLKKGFPERKPPLDCISTDAPTALFLYKTSQTL